MIYSKLKRLEKGFNPKSITETLPTSEYTAYSENKGEKLALCLNKKNEDNSNLIDENTLMFVAIHELGHIESLENFREVNSPLQGHPDKDRLPLMHATTGALGQGLSIAIGHALACKAKNLENNIFCILGDGEVQEFTRANLREVEVEDRNFIQDVHRCYDSWDNWVPRNDMEKALFNAIESMTAHF